MKDYISLILKVKKGDTSKALIILVPLYIIISY